MTLEILRNFGQRVEEEQRIDVAQHEILRNSVRIVLVENKGPKSADCPLKRFEKSI